jgi:hypothetical protein
MKMLALVPILLLTQVSYFDMQGTIVNVLSPTSLQIDSETVNLVGVDPSGITPGQCLYLIGDLKDWLIGKDVFVKGGYVYFDLVGSYNSVSINEMIQKEIQDLRDDLAYILEKNL